ncbi:hypothetical protein ACFQL1_22295 [Halomicroarcula sp. GCM10025709]|uniref:hypothetical protein n=1 Tax=Halomicroarcula sp. GCM10025709 TaxID=3252669 RepID=UPI003617221B
MTNSSFVLHNFERSSGLVDILQNPVVTVRDSQFLLDDNVIAVNAETASVNVQGSTIDGGRSARSPVSARSSAAETRSHRTSIRARSPSRRTPTTSSTGGPSTRRHRSKGRRHPATSTRSRSGAPTGSTTN